MSTIKLAGILTDKFPVQTFPNFAKRVFWLKEPDTERYPQHWEIELHANDIPRLDLYEIGDRLEVEVEVRGRKYTSRSNGEAIALALKAVGIELLNRLDTKPGPVGRYVPKERLKTNQPPERGLFDKSE